MSESRSIGRDGFVLPCVDCAEDMGYRTRLLDRLWLALGRAARCSGPEFEHGTSAPIAVQCAETSGCGILTDATATTIACPAGIFQPVTIIEGTLSLKNPPKE